MTWAPSTRCLLPAALAALSLLLMPSPGLSTDAVDFVLVRKSESMLYLMQGGRTLKGYPIALGRNPVGHKMSEGDQRTPEGVYVLDYKNANSDFYKSIHISYPNEIDMRRAAARGVKPGGMIMIHGQKNGLEWMTDINQRRNWTDGCIALTNQDMDELWEAIAVGTRIAIVP